MMSDIENGIIALNSKKYTAFLKLFSLFTLWYAFNAGCENL
jgi:hypothetical protein